MKTAQKRPRAVQPKERPLKRQRNKKTMIDGLKPSTPVSPLESSLNTSTPKSKIFKPSIRPPSCSEIARLGLISGEKAYSRFYNKSLQEVYASCTLPTETDYAALHTISSRAYSNTMEQKSLWKHTIHCPPRASSQTTYCLSSPFLAHACTAAEAVVDDGQNKEEEKKVLPFQRKEPIKGKPRSYKNRILATKTQWVEIKRVFAAARAAYNFANKRVREDGAPKDIISLKKDWVRTEKDESITGVSMRISNTAVNELVAAYRSNETKKRKDPNFTYEVKDRTSDARSEVIHIDRTKVLLDVIATPHVVGRAECQLIFGNNLKKVGALRVQGKSKIIQKIIDTGVKLHAAAKIQWDKTRNALYFIWIDDMIVPPDPDPTFQHKRIVSLDPGSAPFQQWYSPTSGEFGELLSGTSEVLKKKYYYRLDKLRKRVQQRIKAPQTFVTQRRRTFTWRKRNLKRQRTTKQLRRKLAREQQRLSSYMASAHYDAANFLLKGHDIIIAPVLQTGWMMQKRNRKTGSKLSRNLHTWAHRLFRQRLAYAAARYPGRFVFECAEPGTSKTCTHCGAWKESLRLGDKVYSCSHCGISVDRQLAGARNNFFAAYGMAVGLGWWQ